MGCQPYTEHQGFGRINAASSLANKDADGPRTDNCESALGNADFNGDGRADIFWYGPGGDPDRLRYGTSSLNNFNSTSMTISRIYMPAY